MAYPADHPEFPFVGMVGTVLSVSMWYVCTNQFMVQRCLGARSEWDARMGAIFAGYMKLLLPLIIALPGIIAYKVLGPGMDPNHVFAPAGGASGAGRSDGADYGRAGLGDHVHYLLGAQLGRDRGGAGPDRPACGRSIPGAEQVSWGKWVSAVFMAVAVGLAIMFSIQQGQVFLIIQNIYAYFAAPVAALFIARDFLEAGRPAPRRQ